MTLNKKQNKYGKPNIKIGNENTFEGDFVGGDIYKAGGDIVKGDKIISSESKVYEVNKENVIVEKIVAPYLIKRYGKNKVSFVGAISLISGLITIITAINSMFSVKIYSFLPAAPKSISNWMLFFGFILVLVGSLFLSVLTYHSSTKCKKCKKDFAYEEIKNPIRQDTETEEGTWRTITKTYECKYCGDVDTRKSDPYLIKKTQEN